MNVASLYFSVNNRNNCVTAIRALTVFYPADGFQDTSLTLLRTLGFHEVCPSPLGQCFRCDMFSLPPPPPPSTEERALHGPHC